MELDPVITPQEVKSWCRIDNDADDATIDLLILTAQEHAAAYTGRILEPYTCPSSVKQAIAVFVADLYANREGQTVGTQTFNRLLNPFVLSSL
jgi:hypothetical protein